MNTGISIHRATTEDSLEIAVMVGELLNEIMTIVGVPSFNFSLEETNARLRDFIRGEKYFVYFASREKADAVGFITLFESYALYAEGVFGTISEFFVRPRYRSQNVGFNLMEQAKLFAKSRGWKRLEVTTPPLPQFDKTLAFYQREGFVVSGGRKLRMLL